MKKYYKKLAPEDLQLFYRFQDRLSTMNLNIHMYREILDDITNMMLYNPNQSKDLFQNYEQFCLDIKANALQRNFIENFLFILSTISIFFIINLCCISIGNLLGWYNQEPMLIFTYGISIQLNLVIQQAVNISIVLLGTYIALSGRFHSYIYKWIVFSIVFICSFILISMLPNIEVFLPNYIFAIILFFSLVIPFSYRFYSKYRYHQYKEGKL